MTPSGTAPPAANNRFSAGICGSGCVWAGLTFSQAGAACGIDGSYFRRLTVGERCPSRSVALKIIFALDLDQATAEQLLSESMDKTR